MSAPAQTTFEEIGLCPILCDAVKKLGWDTPTPIQSSTFQKAMNKEPVAGMAETGSGKTGAYLLPLLQRFLDSENPQKFAVILAPTRELVLQIVDVIASLTREITISICPCYGGVDDVEQMVELSKDPNIIVATPGRLANLLRTARSFTLHGVKIVVVDEADKMANASFFDDIREIVSSTALDRQLLLFSATMPQSIDKLKTLSMDQTSLVQLTSTQQVPAALKEEMLVHSPTRKECALVYLLDRNPDQQVIVFINKVGDTQIIGDMLKFLNFQVVICHGGMHQTERDAAVQLFREREARIICASQSIARGIDCHVDIVINYDIPEKNHDYIHRVGRAGRAGKGGLAITFASRETQKRYQQLEVFLKRKLQKRDYPEKESLDENLARVTEAKEKSVDKYKEASRKRSTQPK